MNPFALAAGALTLLALGAHAFVGAREFRQFAPRPTAGAPRMAWVQALSGWHWVSVDLLLATALFVLIGAADVVPDEPTVLLGLSLYFAACGVAWLVTVAVTGRRSGPGRFVQLGQWIFCLVVAGLALAAR
ncbi:MAG: hypothetical protein AAF970_08985 [Bacteroidota bacterium]